MIFSHKETGMGPDFLIAGGLRFKTLPDAVECDFQRLGQDARLSQDGHEVRVASPAGYDVEMYMRLHACAGGLPNVGSDIERLRMVDPAQDSHAAGGQFHHFGAGLGIELFEIGDVLKGDDHQMTAGIWIAVQDHIGAFSPEGDQVLNAILFFLRHAENTPNFLVAFDIFHTPRGPDVIHKLV